MVTLLLLLSPVIMILIAFVVFNASSGNDLLKNNGRQLIKISIKYAALGVAMALIYAFFSLSLRGNISISEINDESIAALLFLCPVGSAFGQLIALIRWKYLRIS